MNPSAIIQWIDRFQQDHRWAAFPIAVAKKFGDDRAGERAALIAYYGFFSLFPLLLALVTILGLVLRNDPGLRERILDSALAQFPIIGTDLKNVAGLSGSALALVIGVGGAVWSGLAVVTAAQAAMDDVWDVPRKDRPPFLRSRLRALLMLLVLALAVSVSGMLSGFATNGSVVSPVLRLAALAGGFLVNLALVASAFRILTVAHVSWRNVMPGAVIAAVAWEILLLVGAWLVDRQIRQASEVYGLFAVVIGLLTWMYVGAQITLVAAEVNVVLARRLWPRSLKPPPLTDPDRTVLGAEARQERARPEETIDVDFGSSESRGPR